MTETTPTTCNASACCCDERLKRLEKRVCRIRTGLLVALGFLLLLIGIAIGKGGERREELRERAGGMELRRGMAPRMGPGPMPGSRGGPMPGRMGPGPGANRGPDDEMDAPAPRGGRPAEGN